MLCNRFGRIPYFLGNLQECSSPAVLAQRINLPLYFQAYQRRLVSDNGVENLSDNLPLEMDDIERLIKEVGVIQRMP
jgi:hypothetical protein